MTLDGAPRELHVLRPDRMTVVPGARGWPAAYDYTIDGRASRITRDASGFLPVLHLALLAVAGMAVEVHNASAAWSKALLDNAAHPPAHLYIRGRTPPPA